MPLRYDTPPKGAKKLWNTYKKHYTVVKTQEGRSLLEARDSVQPKWCKSIGLRKVPGEFRAFPETRHTYEFPVEMEAKAYISCKWPWNLQKRYILCFKTMLEIELCVQVQKIHPKRSKKHYTVGKINGAFKKSKSTNHY